MPPLTAIAEALSRHEVDRRSAERHSANLDATTRLLETEVTLAWGATVRDITTNGIGLTLCFPFPAGSYLAVELESKQKKMPSLLARVVHAQDLPDGTWHIGCEFVKPLSPSELDIIL